MASEVTNFRIFINNVEVNTSSMRAGKSYWLDFANAGVDGTNIIQVSNIVPISAKKTVTIYVPYPSVISGTAADVGMDEDIVGLISDFINAEAKYGFSGAQLAIVKDGKLVVNEAYGLANRYKPDGERIRIEDDSYYVPVTTDTLYDLASNAKMFSVNYAIQYLVDQGKVGLDDKITKFFPEFAGVGKTVFKDGADDTMKNNIYTWKSQLTIRDILMHQTGFDPDPQYHNDKFNQAEQKADPNVENPLFSQDRETTLEMVLASPLTYKPGTKTVYSDVDYEYYVLCVGSSSI